MSSLSIHTGKQIYEKVVLARTKSYLGLPCNTMQSIPYLRIVNITTAIYYYNHSIVVHLRTYSPKVVLYDSTYNNYVYRILNFDP